MKECNSNCSAESYDFGGAQINEEASAEVFAPWRKGFTRKPTLKQQHLKEWMESQRYRGVDTFECWKGGEDETVDDCYDFEEDDYYGYDE